MGQNKIQYADKITSNPQPSIPAQNKVSGADMTEIKNVINNNADDSQTQLDGKVSSTIVGEPTGSDVVVNMVSLTQAEYDAGTPVATTFYIITD